MDLLVVRGYGALAPHYELWVQARADSRAVEALTEAGAAPVGAALVEAFRIAEGIPAYGIDIAERDLPQETSQMRALNFNKGCYLGQEIVERIRSRGNVHRHLRPLELRAASGRRQRTDLEGGAAGADYQRGRVATAPGTRLCAGHDCAARPNCATSPSPTLQEQPRARHAF